MEEEYRLAKTVYKDPGADARRKSKLEAVFAQHNNCKPWKLFANMAVQANLRPCLPLRLRVPPITRWWTADDDHHGAGLPGGGPYHPGGGQRRDLTVL